MSGAIILCGLGRTGTRVLTYLRAAHMHVVVIDDRCKPDDPRLHGARLVSGDCREPDVLERAGVATARGVVVMTSDDLVNVTCTLQVRAIAPNVRIIIRLLDQNLLDRLGQTVNNVYSLSVAMLTAPVLAMTAMTGAVIGAFRIGDERDDGRLVAEVIVAPHDPLHGKSIADAIEARGAKCLAHLPFTGTERMPGQVDAREHLQPGDLVVLCGEPRHLGAVLRGADDGAPALRWANYLYRLGRVAWRTFAEIETLVLVCAALLISVLLIATAVFHLGIPNYSIAKSLFRAVSIMATSADMHREELQDMPRMQIFVSALRIIGAVLLAAFTAIFTNYLVRTRLGSVLEVRRIPESGHVVVCGLGSIGFLTVKELLQSGERVVAIEKDLTNPYVATARRLGAAVIIGDAGLSEVQKQARMKSAYSVIASTSNDLVNLSIALLAHEANRHQRVVVLLSEPRIASMLRHAAGVELALSVPAMAAPAFLAALYGDRVRTVVMVRRHLLAVLDVVIQEGDPLAGLTPVEAAARYHFRPVALMDSRGDTLVATPKLTVGQRLVVVVALPDLEALLGRQPAKMNHG